MLKLIVALDEERGIGKDNGIPWFIPGELGWVARTTKETTHPGTMNALIMGRKTWDSLPEDKRPLTGRFNIVVTRDAGKVRGEPDFMCSSLEDALNVLDLEKVEHAFIFGGAGLYEEALNKGFVEEVLLTHVPGTHEADTFFPELPEHFTLSDTSLHEYGEVTVRREVWKA